MDELRPGEVDEHADGGEHEAGDQDRTGDVGGVVALVQARMAATEATNDALVPR